MENRAAYCAGLDYSCASSAIFIQQHHLSWLMASYTNNHEAVGNGEIRATISRMRRYRGVGNWQIFVVPPASLDFAILWKRSRTSSLEAAAYDSS